MRRDKKMGANGSRMKGWSVGKMKEMQGGITLQKEKTARGRQICMGKIAGHTGIQARIHLVHTLEPVIVHAHAHTSHPRTWGVESGALSRDLGGRNLAPLCKCQQKQQFIAERKSSHFQSRNSLMSSYGKACRHTLIHTGERGIIRITQPFIDGRQLASYLHLETLPLNNSQRCK